MFIFRYVDAYKDHKTLRISMLIKQAVKPVQQTGTLTGAFNQPS